MVDLEQFREAVDFMLMHGTREQCIRAGDMLQAIIDNAGKAGGVDDAAARVWEAMQEAGYLYSGGPLADAHPDDQQHARRIALAALAAHDAVIGK